MAGPGHPSPPPRRARLRAALAISAAGLDRAGVTGAGWAWLLPVVIVELWAFASIPPDLPGLMVAGCAWLAAGAALALARVALAPMAPGAARRWATLASYALAGMSSWAACMVIAPPLGMALPGPAGRVQVFVANAVVWLSVIAILVDQQRRARAALLEMASQQAQWETLRLQADAQVADTTAHLDAVVAQVRGAVRAARAALATAERPEDLLEVAEGLSATVQFLVRPTSHRLARPTGELAGPRPRRRARLRERTQPGPWEQLRGMPAALAAGRPFQPVAVTLVCLPLLLAAMTSAPLSWPADLVPVAGLALEILVLAGAQRWWRRIGAALGLGARVAAILGTYLAMPGAYVLASLALAPGHPVHVAGALVPPTVALLAGWASSLEWQRRRARDEVARLVAQSRWAAAATQQQLWALQRRLGLAMHGRVQAGLTAVAMLLRAWARGALPDEPRAVMLARVDQTFDECLAALADHTTPSLPDLVEELVAIWEGVLDIDLDLAPDALAALGADEAASAAAGEILRELLLNGVRHGGAESAQVRLGMRSGDVVGLAVRTPVADSAADPAQGSPGLGTELMRSLSLGSEVTVAGGSRTTTVLLAVRPSTPIAS